MNKQEVFTKVQEHFFNMPGPAVEDGGCVYWKADGNRCFVGALLPEEGAKALAEFVDRVPTLAPVGDYENWPEEHQKSLETAGLWPHMMFLSALQSIHDEAVYDGSSSRSSMASVEEWRRECARRLLRLALDHGLKIHAKLVTLADIELEEKA